MTQKTKRIIKTCFAVVGLVFIAGLLTTGVTALCSSKVRDKLDNAWDALTDKTSETTETQSTEASAVYEMVDLDM